MSLAQLLTKRENTFEFSSECSKYTGDRPHGMVKIDAVQGAGGCQIATTHLKLHSFRLLSAFKIAFRV